MRRIHTVRFRVDSEELDVIKKSVGENTTLSDFSRDTLLSKARELQDPRTRKIANFNAKIKEIDEKLSSLQAERDVLVGLIEKEVDKK